MTAFLTLDVLRAHAAPVGFHFAHAAPVNLRDALGRADAPRPVLSARFRPVLSARWRIAPDGRLACRWLADDSPPDRPPL